MSCTLRFVDCAACQLRECADNLVIKSGCPQAPPTPTLLLEPRVASDQTTRGPLGLLRPTTCFTS